MNFLVSMTTDPEPGSNACRPGTSADSLPRSEQIDADLASSHRTHLNADPAHVIAVLTSVQAPVMAARLAARIETTLATESARRSHYTQEARQSIGIGGGARRLEHLDDPDLGQRLRSGSRS